MSQHVAKSDQFMHVEFTVYIIALCHTTLLLHSSHASGVSSDSECAHCVNYERMNIIYTYNTCPDPVVYKSTTLWYILE